MFDAALFCLFLLFLFSHTSLLFTLFSKSTDHPGEVTWSQPAQVCLCDGCRLMTMLELLISTITKRRLKLILKIWVSVFVLHFVYFAVFYCFKFLLKLWTRRRLSASNKCRESASSPSAPAGGARAQFKHQAQKLRENGRSCVWASVLIIMCVCVCLIRASAALKQHKAKGPEQEVTGPTVTPTHATEDQRPKPHRLLCPWAHKSVWFLLGFTAFIYNLCHICWLWFMSNSAGFTAHIIITITIQFSW